MNIRPLIGALIALLLLPRASSHSATTPSERQLATTTETDIAAFLKHRKSLRAVMDFVRLRSDLFPTEPLPKMRMLGRGDRGALWGVWRTALRDISALDDLARRHGPATNAGAKGRDMPSRVIAHGVALAEYRLALEFIDSADKDPSLDTLLNDAIPDAGLPKDSYYHFKSRFLRRDLGATLDSLRTAHKQLAENAPPRLRAAMDEDAAAIAKISREKLEQLNANESSYRLKKVALRAWFPLQAGVSEWMGDTKVIEHARSRVSEAQIREMPKRLQPGDIFLARREWYISNLGVPGFWPHSGMYIGTPGERRTFFDDPEVKAWVQQRGGEKGDFEALLRATYPSAYAKSLKPHEHGHVTRVIEVVSEGAVFSSIEHAADTDSLVMLRPRLSRKEKAVALFRAFGYHGRPYDFDFDFLTDSTLLCSELLYKSYEPSDGYRGLKFHVREIHGRLLTPANDIARQFDVEFGTPAQQLDLVFFLDGYKRGASAVEASAEEFRNSHKRAKWKTFLPKVPARR